MFSSDLEILLGLEHIPRSVQGPTEPSPQTDTLSLCLGEPKATSPSPPAVPCQPRACASF